MEIMAGKGAKSRSHNFSIQINQCRIIKIQGNAGGKGANVASVVSVQMFYIVAPFWLKVATNNLANGNKWGKEELRVNKNLQRAARGYTWPIPNDVLGF